ncbi:MAG: nuclear transport factor 2 family protein [Novosphingobium sp.]|nr:nuclear transport factor 2 family protein [Novosphingobium sp.]
MSDELAIQQLLNAYSYHASTGDLEAMVATYAQDGVWEVPGIGALCTGHAEILAAAKAITGTIDYMVQMNAPALIEVNGDTATARSVIRECGKYAGRNTNLEVLGLYEDQLRRTAEGWRFTRRRFTVRGMHDYQTAPPSLHG